MREKAHQQFRDVSRAFCALDRSGQGQVTKRALRELLQQMMLFMEKEEFDRLWSIADPAGAGAISFEDFLQKLGILS